MRERLSSFPSRLLARAGGAPRASTTAERLEQIRLVTRHFSRLQGGLNTKLPWAIGLLLMGVSDLTPPSAWGFALFFPVLVLTYGGFFLLMRKVNQYYRRLGQVERPVTNYLAAPWPRKVAFIAYAGWFVWILNNHTEPRWLYAGIGAILIWLWFDMGRSLSLLYYPVLGVLVLAAGAPDRTFGYLLPAMGSAALSHIFVGFVIALVALLDHRQLVVTLARFPITAEQPEDAALAEEAR
jgi:hypothetical protein